MHFTIAKDVKIDKRIFSDLEKVRKLILQNIADVDSLILVGGFGRGEGSVLDENGLPKPLNDYDIVLIVEKEGDETKLKNLSKDIAQKIGIRFIDFISIKKNTLRRLPCTMFNYDLKYGSYIFYGNKNILEIIPEYDPAQLPLEEGKKLLFNRMICLLESYPEEFKKRRLTDDEKFFLAIQTGKAILSCSDSLLVLKGKYHFSYIERYKRFSQIFKDDKIVSLVQQATDFRLRPYCRIDFDLIRYWFETRTIFLNTLQTFLEILYKKKFQNWEKFSRFYLNSTRPLVKRWFDKIIGRKQVLQKINLELTHIYLLAARTESGIDESYLKLAHEKLRLITDINNKESYLAEPLWESLRKLCVELWFSILH